MRIKAARKVGAHLSFSGRLGGGVPRYARDGRDVGAHARRDARERVRAIVGEVFVNL